VHILSADPTCRWAQRESLDEILRLVGHAMATTERLPARLPARPRGTKRRRPARRSAAAVKEA